MKRFWLREELSCADELLSHVPALREEFLAYHTDFIDGSYAKSRPITDWLPKTNMAKNDNDSYPWKVEPLKYAFDQMNIKLDMYNDPEVVKNFPTAATLTKKWSADCGCATYSVLEKNTVIVRHTGNEDRDNNYIRIHVPLIVPDGDVFFECEGQEIDWSDIWGFNGQLVHSVYNNTNQRRLVFLIDIRRSAIGLPPADPYDPEREKTIPNFVRGAVPKLYHSCQLVNDNNT